MTYDKEVVSGMFNESGNGIGKLYPHQKDFLTAVKFFLRTKGSFSMDEIHELLVYMGRPETSKYNSLATVLVNSNLIIKEDGRFWPTALMCSLITA